jgi:hypothetical protein
MGQAYGHDVANTTLQDEAMSDPRQLERLLKKVQHVKQRDEYWVGTSRLARMWITPRQAPPYRPYVTLLVSQEGKVLRSNVLDHPPTADALFADLLRAMRRPMWGAGGARRPTRIYVDNENYVAALTPRLAPLHVQCAYHHRLSMAAEEAWYAMETRMGKYKPIPGLVSIPSVTPPLLCHLYQLAAQFYQAAPWQWLHDHHPLAIRYPPEDTPRYAIVMGSGGEVFGLAVYDTLDDLQLMYESDRSPRQIAKMATWSVLFFEEATAMSFDDLDAMAQYNWPVATHNAYPVFGRTTSDQAIVPPAKSDLLWMEGALAGILTYLDEHLELHQGVVQPAEVTLSVTLMGGEAQVHLTILGFDTVFPEKHAKA